MDRITPDNHPDFVAVISEYKTFADALYHGRMLLLAPRFSAVAILRRSQTLCESHRRAARMLDRSRDGVLLIDNKRPQEDSFVVRDWKDTTRRRISNRTVSAHRLEKLIGPDLLELSCAARREFPHFGPMELRRRDDANGSLHIDRNNRKPYMNLPGAVSLTMAVHGGGTVIAEMPDTDLDRVTHRDGKEEWYYAGPQQPGSNPEWQIGDGDAVLMRARDWPATHKPCIHRSPPRARPSDASERVVGVFLT